MTPRISRTGYVLLAIFFGGFGIHNFIAGYKTKGIIQLLMGTVGWVTLGLLPFAACVWAWIDAFTVTHDADGAPMSPNAVSIADSFDDAPNAAMTGDAPAALDPSGEHEPRQAA